MSEEQQVQDHNDGTWSGLKKTIVGTLGTVVTGGGVWLGTMLYGGNHEEKSADAPAQAQPTIVINNSQQQQAAPATKTVVVQQPAAQAAPAQTKPAEPVKKKDAFATEEPKW